MSEKNCDNCRYYKQHYVKEITYFLQIGGHCINPKIVGKKKWCSDCDLWEPIEIRNAERREAICETLRNMEKHLAEIVFILKDE